MKILSKEKAKVLAERHGWSIARAEGYLEGLAFRRRGKPPTIHGQVGIDDYSLGFRAGYYERRSSGAIPASSSAPMASLPAVRPVEAVESLDLVTVSAQAG